MEFQFKPLSVAVHRALIHRSLLHSRTAPSESLASRAPADRGEHHGHEETRTPEGEAAQQAGAE